MDFPEIVKQLNDLPATYKRLETPYTNLVEALASALFLYTSASDGIFSQSDFATASNGWVDVWGSLAGISRRVNESDSVYHNRISNMVLAHHATPVSITDWLTIVEQVAGTVTEFQPGLGYQITLPPILLVSQIKQILADLAYVRPAGVPFKIVQTSGNTYLDTVNYLGSPHITGAYLAGSVININSLIKGYTTNAVGLLPDLLFTDPMINPDLPPEDETTPRQTVLVQTQQLFEVLCSNFSFAVPNATVLATYRGGSNSFSWYFDPATLGSNVVAVETNIDTSIPLLETFYFSAVTDFNAFPFNGQPSPTAQDPSGKKFNLIISGPGINPAGAFHCPSQLGDIFINEDYSYTGANMFFGASTMMIECLEANYTTINTTKPWVMTNFVGKALSQAYAEDLMPTSVFGGIYTGQSQTWLNSSDPLQSNANRHDYAAGTLTGNVGASSNRFAVGYFMLMLFWLRYHKSFTWTQIIRNGGVTPSVLCTNLGVTTSSFLTDIQALLPSGTTYDLTALHPGHPDNPWIA